VEDSEEDEMPLQICEVEYEPGDQLFMMRIVRAHSERRQSHCNVVKQES